MKNLPRREGIPLYLSLASIIENKIVSGQYEPGSQLPTEDELTKRFNVSKITVRNALLRLEMDRLIVRRWGKGNFVAEEIPDRKQYIHTNLNDMTKALSQSVTQPVGIEKIHVQQKRPVRPQVHQVLVNQRLVLPEHFTVGVTIGRKPHQFVLAAVNDKPAIVSECGIEQTQGMGEVQFL